MKKNPQKTKTKTLSSTPSQSTPPTYIFFLSHAEIPSEIVSKGTPNPLPSAGDGGPSPFYPAASPTASPGPSGATTTGYGKLSSYYRAPTAAAASPPAFTQRKAPRPGHNPAARQGRTCTRGRRGRRTCISWSGSPADRRRSLCARGRRARIRRGRPVFLRTEEG